MKIMGYKIVDLTNHFYDVPEVAPRKMMLRYVNGDWDFNVVRYLNETIRVMETSDYDAWENAKHKLDYWKYLFLLAKGEKDDAFYHLKKSYEEQGPDATAQYAYFCYTGQGVTNIVNRNKAKKLFDYALSRDSMFAEYLYAEALMYKNENDLEQIKAAIPYYEVALKKGVLFARYKLANCYLKAGVKLDKAIKLFEKCEEPDAKRKIEQAKKLKNTR